MKMSLLALLLVVERPSVRSLLCCDFFSKYPTVDVYLSLHCSLWPTRWGLFILTVGTKHVFALAMRYCELYNWFKNATRFYQVEEAGCFLPTNQSIDHYLAYVRFPALGTRCTFFLRVLIGSLGYLHLFWSVRCFYFVFGFVPVIIKLLVWFKCVQPVI